MSIMNFKIEGTGTGMRFDAVADGKHKVTIDEPASLGGKDTAANPISTLLASLLGCENVMAQIIAKEMNFDLQGISFEVDATLDTRGLMGDPNVDPKLQTVIVKAFLQTSESSERIQQLQDTVDARCPIYQIIKSAGILIRNEWSKAEVGV
ncbi:osmotically inducible protein C [Ammoniphilus oxalaticus]|uniref:Osmotically inducible protein C n=1 Tax=Ammoniphilus oxalaticus TaxID=66863 RepID=A0A419SKP0_9BACL|nr:OsmC family protein [Ammoniphilus oxalaticus]RKD24577.1 osmotically inducible protein C [Ammoniphilus oxalaticus]